MVYAVVKTGGKQYRVTPGDLIDVEKLPTYTGATVELSEVLLVSRDGEVTVGSPLVPNARVVGEVEDQGRGTKLVVFKFKAKTRQRKKTGHRQSYTRLRVKDILVGEVSMTTPESSPEPPKRRRTPTAKVETEAPAAPASASKTPRRRRTPTAKVEEEAPAAPASASKAPKRRRTPTATPTAKVEGEASATPASSTKASRRRRTPTAKEETEETKDGS